MPRVEVTDYDPAWPDQFERLAAGAPVSALRSGDAQVARRAERSRGQRRISHPASRPRTSCGPRARAARSGTRSPDRLALGWGVVGERRIARWTPDPSRYA